jgi:hypothetical protein
VLTAAAAYELQPDLLKGSSTDGGTTRVSPEVVGRLLRNPQDAWEQLKQQQEEAGPSLNVDSTAPATDTRGLAPLVAVTKEMHGASDPSYTGQSQFLIAGSGGSHVVAGCLQRPATVVICLFCR